MLTRFHARQRCGSTQGTLEMILSSLLLRMYKESASRVINGIRLYLELGRAKDVEDGLKWLRHSFFN